MNLSTTTRYQQLIPKKRLCLSCKVGMFRLYTRNTHKPRNLIAVGWFCEPCKRFELDDREIKWPVKQVEYSPPSDFCWYCASDGNYRNREYFKHDNQWCHKSECYHKHVYQLLYRLKDKTRGFRRIAWYCTNCMFFDIINQDKEWSYGNLARESMRGEEISPYYINETKDAWDKCVDCEHMNLFHYFGNCAKCDCGHYSVVRTRRRST
jgi:hypothetical protein